MIRINERNIFNKNIEVIKYSNEDIKNYIIQNHLNDLNITPLYFQKLSLEVFDFCDIMSSESSPLRGKNQTNDRDTEHKDDESRWTQNGFSIREDILYDKMDSVFDNLPKPKFNQIEFSIISQIECLIKNEPEFKNPMGSPRCNLNLSIKLIV